MKRKATEKVIATEILESARRSAGVDVKTRPAKCEVCGSDSAPNANEALCWVCRRLKISAWRDSDLQASSSPE
jgi:predicted Zn-ribbon and HTH transcriptional regulator